MENAKEGDMQSERGEVFVATAARQPGISMRRLAQQTNATPDLFIVELSEPLLGTCG